jgi:fatty-acyl-CoA synthase
MGGDGKAFVELHPGETLTLEEIGQFLSGKVARFKYPRQLEVVEQMPMTASGKIRRAALLKRAAGLEK